MSNLADEFIRSGVLASDDESRDNIINGHLYQAGLPPILMYNNIQCSDNEECLIVSICTHGKTMNVYRSVDIIGGGYVVQWVYASRGLCEECSQSVNQVKLTKQLADNASRIWKNSGEGERCIKIFYSDVKLVDSCK